LDDNWDAESESSKPRNDKITDKDKSKLRAEEEKDNAKDKEHKSGDAREVKGEGGRGGERENRPPYLTMWRDREREKEKEKERERDRDKDEHQRHKDGRSWEKDFLAGYARLKQHYAAKLQASDPGAGTAQQTSASSSSSSTTLKRGWWDDQQHGTSQHQQFFNGMALDGNGEWAGTAAEEGFTYYDLSPSSKVRLPQGETESG
jgi:hypothetical protein